MDNANGIPEEVALLRPRQRKFVELLLLDKEFDVNKAAQAAGYSSGNAGLKILRKSAVAKEIGRRMQERSLATGITAKRVLEELAAIGFFNPLDLMDDKGGIIELRKLPRHVAANIKSMKVSYGEDVEEDGSFTQVRSVDIQFHDKLKALEMLAKHVGILETVINNTIINNIDWSQLFNPERRKQLGKMDDPIEAKIKSVSQYVDNSKAMKPKVKMIKAEEVNVKDIPPKPKPSIKPKVKVVPVK